MEYLCRVFRVSTGDYCVVCGRVTGCIGVGEDISSALDDFERQIAVRSPCSFGETDQDVERIWRRWYLSMYQEDVHDDIFIEFEYPDYFSFFFGK